MRRSRENQRQSERLERAAPNWTRLAFLHTGPRRVNGRNQRPDTRRQPTASPNHLKPLASIGASTHDRQPDLRQPVGRALPARNRASGWPWWCTLVVGRTAKRPRHEPDRGTARGGGDAQNARGSSGGISAAVGGAQGGSVEAGAPPRVLLAVTWASFHSRLCLPLWCIRGAIGRLPLVRRPSGPGLRRTTLA